MITPDAYLTRLNLDPADILAAGPTLDTLTRLHLAHLYAVPFENLDIHRNTYIRIDIDRILHKIVSAGRGGFCYELNGAFACLLHELGYSLTLLSAGVYGTHLPGPDFDHLALKVNCEGNLWLVDVGFGEGFMTPLRFKRDIVQSQPTGDFRLVLADGWHLLECRKPGEEEWRPTYRFHDSPRNYHEFMGMCSYQQFAEESHFRQGPLCSLALPNGRITVAGDLLIETIDGERRETKLEDEAAVAEVLRERFGVELGG